MSLIVETNIIERIFYGMPNEGFRHSEETRRKIRLASTGRKLSKEARKKISESNRRRKVSDETRRKQSRRMKEFCASGGQNLTKGRKHSEETRRKLSKLAKKRLADPTKHPMYGRKHSAESRRRNSEAQKKLHAGGYQSPFKGKKHSKSSIKKMRESHKGAKAPNKGRKHSEETKRKIREARARQVITNETRRKMSRSQKKRVSRPDYVSPRQGKKDSAETKKLKSDIVKERYKDKTKHPFYGKKHKKKTIKQMKKSHIGYKATEETKQKQSLGLMGHYVSKETRQKLRAKMLGKITKQETKEKISKSLMGKMAGAKNPMYGKPAWNTGKTGIYSEATIEKFRIARAKRKFPAKDTTAEKILQGLCKAVNAKFTAQRDFDLGFQHHQVDVFVEPNICLEADGDYWHANPAEYPPSTVMHKASKHRKQAVLARDIRAKDARINRGLEKLGFQVLRFWGSDLEKTPEECLRTIINALDANVN